MGMGRGEKGSLESPDIFSELWRKTEVSLSLFGLNEQGQEVGESCRGKCRVDTVENILTIGIVCISWRQMSNMDNERLFRNEMCRLCSFNLLKRNHMSQKSISLKGTSIWKKIIKV